MKLHLLWNPERKENQSRWENPKSWSCTLKSKCSRGEADSYESPFSAKTNSICNTAAWRLILQADWWLLLVTFVENFTLQQILGWWVTRLSLYWATVNQCSTPTYSVHSCNHPFLSGLRLVPGWGWRPSSEHSRPELYLWAVCLSCSPLSQCPRQFA